MNRRSIIISVVSLLMAGVVIFVGVQMVLLVGSAPATGEQKKAAPLPPVVYEELQRRDIAPRQWIVGNITPMRLSKVGSAASGRVEQFLVKEGDWVKKGQTIAQLRIAIVKAETDAAWETYLSQKAELKRLKESLPHEIKQAEARLEKSIALRDFMATKRSRTAGAGVAVSRQDMDEAISLEKQAKASLDENQATLRLLKETANTKIQFAEAKMNAAYAEWERLDEQLQRHTIRSPFDGYVVAEHTQAGEWALQSDLVATIAELHHVEIEVPVLEDYISHLYLNNIVEVEIPALPPGMRTFQGEVVLIVPSANKLARTFPVKIRVANKPADYKQIAGNAAGAVSLIGMAGGMAAAGFLPSDAAIQGMLADEYSYYRGPVLLKAGMLARVKLPTGPFATKVLAVPRDAINIEGESYSIMIADSDSEDKSTGKVRMVPVHLGISHEDYIEVIPIQGELKEGDLVITEGNERVRPGQVVELRRK